MDEYLVDVPVRVWESLRLRQPRVVAEAEADLGRVEGGHAVRRSGGPVAALVGWAAIQ